MKKNYLKKSLVFTFTCLLSISFSQQARLASPEKIDIDWDTCPYTPTSESSDFKVLRSEFVKNRMEARVAPCSNIIVTYNGFTSEAQAAFQFAVDIWENLLDTSVPIRVNADFGPLNPGVLGGARPDGFLINIPGFPSNVAFPSALGEHLLGEDSDGPTGVSNDIDATFSSTANFYFGLDANPPIGQIDFVSVVLHELGHGLGVLGFGRVPTDTDGNPDPDPPVVGLLRDSGFISPWDQFIENGTLLAITIFADPSASLLTQFTSGDLFCNSPIAVSQNGDSRPPTYAPSVFSPGTSYSHWDETTFNNTANALMTPFISPGEAIHDPGNVTLGFMEDMGWTLCDQSLSTNDNLALENISVSPNPFSNDIVINLPQNATNDGYKISIFDINGRQVFNEELSVIDGKIAISNLESLKQAMYFVEILNTSTNSSITKKLIKI